MTISMDKPTLRTPQYYKRELNWLQFNNRALHKAFNQRTPLLERLNVLATFSTNLDDFFMVQVPELLDQAQTNITNTPGNGITPRQQLEHIHDHLLPIVQRQHTYFFGEMRSHMETEGIYLLTYDRLNQQQQSHLTELFESHIFPILTPLGVDPAHPFPRMSNLSLNIAAEIEDPETQTPRFVRIKVPNNLPRFISFPDNLKTVDHQPVSWAGIALEDIIIRHLASLFPGMAILNSHPFRITRATEVPTQKNKPDNHLLAIQQDSTKRQLDGSVVRLEVASTFPKNLQDSLIQEFQITPDDVYQLDGHLNLRDLYFFCLLPTQD
ncbi:MAG: hypothetical protein KTR27_05520 [Leptolyngbyaceae cyanobacterium MAG.088]|nr:hypothetical protein [Leptolyngbyaceae cyanobacterium MAG.088]